jgi:hypothetical protein
MRSAPPGSLSSILRTIRGRNSGPKGGGVATTYASAGNAIYPLDDADLYARYGGAPDDSLVHESAHYLQATHLRDRFTTDGSESEAVAIRSGSPERMAHVINTPRPADAAVGLNYTRSCRSAGAGATRMPSGVW